MSVTEVVGSSCNPVCGCAVGSELQGTRPPSELLQSSMILFTDYNFDQNVLYLKIHENNFRRVLKTTRTI